MLGAYLSVICASLILADMRGYHAQLSTVASDIDMISVIFIRGKLLKLHAPMSIHAPGISALSQIFHVWFKTSTWQVYPFGSSTLQQFGTAQSDATYQKLLPLSTLPMSHVF